MASASTRGTGSNQYRPRPAGHQSVPIRQAEGTGLLAQAQRQTVEPSGPDLDLEDKLDQQRLMAALFGTDYTGLTGSNKQTAAVVGDIQEVSPSGDPDSNTIGGRTLSPTDYTYFRPLSGTTIKSSKQLSAASPGAGGAMNGGIFKVMLQGGHVAVHKYVSLQGRDTEVLAAVVGEAIDAPVGQVIAGPDISIIVPLVPGQPGSVLVDRGVPAEQQQEQAGDSFHRLKVFDYLVANVDRHPGNWVVQADGVIVGIDHELTFTGGTPNIPHRPKNRVIPLAANTRTAGQQYDEWVRSLRPNLERTADQFAALHRQGWHQAMMRRYDSLRQTIR